MGLIIDKYHDCFVMIRRVALWLVFCGPRLGWIAPHLFAFGIGCNKYERTK